MKIKEKLDSYLEFDSSLLFTDPLIRVFGGAIRDIIADSDINDIDILCGSESCFSLSSLLESKGYSYLDLSKFDISSLYTDVDAISQPLTYLKGKKMVQLIRPRIVSCLDYQFPKDDLPYNTISNKKFYSENFVKLISEVDLSCCGVSYDGKLYENVPYAISHCLLKVFQVNYGRFYNEKRIPHRKAKLLNRGWEELIGASDIRDVKINNIIENNIDYILEY